MPVYQAYSLLGGGGIVIREVINEGHAPSGVLPAESLELAGAGGQRLLRLGSLSGITVGVKAFSIVARNMG